MFFNCNRRGHCGHHHNEDIVVSPTETIVHTTTNYQTVKHIHPTEIVHVNRHVIRNEHFYPVTEREVNETIVENYDCGRDIRHPRCRRVEEEHSRHKCNHCHCKRHR
ncbi:CotD family spore coat protein [Bacillus badius]|uniref:CotD family spore coat protein n=1 Tax=Bacillus badius TaxID=1455 RepID=UPI0009E1FC89|nr:CotD family spore coat protein [Bacillus badius]MED4718466.1 CotD family spore coat protein [Bacillus badius]